MEFSRPIDLLAKKLLIFNCSLELTLFIYKFSEALF